MDVMRIDLNNETKEREGGMTYLTCAETAKLLRKALKKNFPGVKFSVRSDRNSIRIEYLDGPAKSEVEKIANVFEGAGFDGMIDLKYYKSHAVNEDGDVILVSSTGTASSGGYVPEMEETELPEGYERVSLGSNYVTVTKNYSIELAKEATKEASEYYGFDLALVEVKESEYDGHAWINSEKLLASEGYSNEARIWSNRIYETLNEGGAK